MNTLVVISACVAVVAGMPQYYPYSAAYANPYAAVAPTVYAQAPHVTYDYNVIADEAPAPAPAPVYVPQYAPYVPNEIKSQYHSQDELGQYAYGHASAGQAHSAVRDYTGAVRGSYTYINAEGEEVVAHYIADAGGFRVSSNALPVAPTFDGEAPVAPEFNLEAPVFDLEAPVFDLEQVMDTPEVEAAKAEHFRLVAEHKAAVEAALAASAEAAEAPAEETPAEVAEEETVVEETPVAEAAVAEEETAAEETPVVETAEVATEEPEAAEAATEVPEVEAAVVEEEAAATEEEAAARRKRSLLLNAAFPTFYNYAPVKPIELKVEAPKPIAPAVHDAELLRVVHNPSHAVSYRVY